MSKKTKPKSEEVIRKTLTLTPRILEWAEELRREGGFVGLSDFVSYLIRRRKEEHEAWKIDHSNFAEAKRKERMRTESPDEKLAAEAEKSDPPGKKKAAA